MKIETYEVFGENFSQIILAATIAGAVEEFERTNGVSAIGVWNVKFKDGVVYETNV